MTEPTHHRPGTLCWADLFAPDPVAAERFYAELFDWQYLHAGPAYENYTYAMAGRQMVAGLARSNDDRAGWVVSFATSDADAVATRVTTAGGRLVDDPSDFGVQGRSVSAVDTAGAQVAFWQPRAHQGAGRMHEAGSLHWAELAVHDAGVADDFYAQVLDLHPSEHAAAGSSDYAAYHLDGEPVAGRTLLPPASEQSAFWLPYFGSDDVERAVQFTTEQGGEVVYSGSTTDGVQVGVLTDPWGGVFGVLAVDAA